MTGVLQYPSLIVPCKHLFPGVSLAREIIDGGSNDPQVCRVDIVLVQGHAIQQREPCVLAGCSQQGSVHPGQNPQGAIRLALDDGFGHVQLPGRIRSGACG